MIYDSKRLHKFSLAQIAFNAAGTKFYFPDQPQLRGKKVQKISCYNYQLMLRNPDGIAPVQVTALSKSFLVLYVNGREDIKIPLFNLTTQTSISGNGNFFTNNGYISLFDLPIVWEKSYILCPTTYTPTAAQEVWIFGVFFQD